LRLQRSRVRFERAQRIGHVLKRQQHRLPVLRRGLIVGGDCGAALVLELAGVEQRLQQTGADAPDARPGEKAMQLRRLCAEAARQRDLRILVCRGDADLRAGLMQQGLGGANVGPLPCQLGRQRQRQVPRQGQR
jgi:hypothetical protein